MNIKFIGGPKHGKIMAVPDEDNPHYMQAYQEVHDPLAFLPDNSVVTGWCPVVKMSYIQTEYMWGNCKVYIPEGTKPSDFKSLQN